MRRFRSARPAKSLLRKSIRAREREEREGRGLREIDAYFAQLRPGLVVETRRER